ncbi:MAG: amidohydrolase family protein, partial [Chloroflexota bacterium]
MTIDGPTVDGHTVSGQRSTFRRELAAEIASLWVLDAHEHIVEEAERTERAQDCFYLTAHYCTQDLVSAGMSPPDVDALTDGTLPLAQRWARFAPSWEFARTTGYGQAVELAARQVFGVDGLNAATYQVLSERIAASAGQPGWYEHILKEKARFIGCILDGWRLEVDRRHFFPVLRFDAMIMARTRREIEGLWECRGREVGSLDDYLAALDAAFDTYVAQGVVAIKCGLAYRRTLRFERVSREVAKPLFQRARRDDLPAEAAKPLQDFLFQEVCDRAGALGLPYQIHTGLQATNANARIDFTNPVLLIDTLKAHPQTRFDLFHGGYPYGGELATIGKN